MKRPCTRTGAARASSAGARLAAHALAGIAWVALAALLPGGVARGAAIPDDECMTCHADPELAGGTLPVSAAELDASAHGTLACVACHSDASTIPHPEVLAPIRCTSCHGDQLEGVARSVHAAIGARPAPRGKVRGGGGPGAGSSSCVACHGTHDTQPADRIGMQICGRCHAQVVEDYQGSVHGKARAGGDRDASTCTDCHGPTHRLLTHRDERSPTSRARLAETCARCHADRELMTRRKITIPEAYALYQRSVHGRSRDARAATCNDCHESHRLRRAADPASSIYRTNIPGTCGRCHADETRGYTAGVHGQALARGVTDSPVCTDCHGEHLIRGPRDVNSPVAAAGVTRTCAACHEAQGIRETYGLPAGRLSTYQDSYHGLAARGGSPAVANCASCHGEHEILPSSDPRSPISAGRLPETCGKCHPGAGTRFAMGPVHVAMTTADQPLLFWVRWAYLALITVTIGFMTLHNGLDYAAKLRRHLRVHLGLAARAVHGAGRWYWRMTLGERIQHALLTVSFFTLVYTGFALKFPEAWPFAWLARLERGYAWRGLIHRGAALVMVGVALFHLGYLITRRGRETLRAMRPSRLDARQLWENLRYMAGRRPEPPAFGRYGYAEKAEYWALVWGTGVMTLTGFVLWYENQSLRWLAKWALDLATVVHYYEAWLAFLAILVWHLYQVMLNPDVYPMNFTWLTGRISEEQLRHEHRAEWERIQEEEARREAEERAEAEAARAAEESVEGGENG